VGGRAGDSAATAGHLGYKLRMEVHGSEFFAAEGVGGESPKMRGLTSAFRWILDPPRLPTDNSGRQGVG
jgi:hypothetical protein